MWRGHYGAYPRGRPGGQRRGVDAFFLMMLAQLIQRIAELDNKPPVTLSVMGACFLTFFQEFLPPQWQSIIPSVGKACLQPYMIIQNRQWSRLIWAAILHADEWHLYYNMSSLLWKGVQLERRYGSKLFAALLAELLLLSHGMFVLLAVLAAYYVPEYRYMYMSNCAIGISAVLFALKVVLNYNSPGSSTVLGITLPTKYMAWAELLLASVFNPQASFLGHLAGIMAGLLHVRLLAPAAPALLRAWRRMQLQARIRTRPGQPRFAARTAAAAAADNAASGAVRAAEHWTSNSRPQAAAAAAVHQERQQRQRQNPGMSADQQGRRLGAGAAGAVAAADDVVEVQASSRQPISAEELRLRRLQRFS